MIVFRRLGARKQLVDVQFLTAVFEFVQPALQVYVNKERVFE